MQRARALDDFVIWTLSVLLAAVFLLAGVPKVVGTSPVGFQAAAMQGFPAALRVLVGLAEIAGAVVLLVPRTATLAAACLALLMIPAVATQYMSGQPGLWVPVVVFVLLAFVAWRRNAERVTSGYRDFAGAPHPLLREGVVAGLLGALVIAVWFGILDTIAGHPFFTPATLGRALLGVLGPISANDGRFTFVFVYTVFHFAAFILVGLVASLIVQVARFEPSILFGFAILFAVTEIGIYGLVALLEGASALGRNSWLPIMVGNLLAALAMGLYFWRRHGELPNHFRRAFDDVHDGEGLDGPVVVAR